MFGLKKKKEKNNKQKNNLDCNNKILVTRREV